MIVDLSVEEVQDAPLPPETPKTEGRRRGGLKGGKMRAKRLSKKRSEIARKAAIARWERSRGSGERKL